MKVYLELTETFINAEGLAETGQVLRIEVVSRDEAVAKVPLYEPLFLGKTYLKEIHYCNHDESAKVTNCSKEIL